MKEYFIEKVLEMYETSDIKDFAIKCIDTIPDYFWNVPASSTGKYHPDYALGNGGLVRHTLALLIFMNHIFELDCIKEKYTDRERDMMRIAGMMHDTRKSGTQEEYKVNKFTKFNHPLLAANIVYKVWADNQEELNVTKDEVMALCKAIASHMGQWNIDKRNPEVKLPLPSSDYEIIVHICDYLASRKDIDVKFDNLAFSKNTSEPGLLPSIDTWILPFGKYKGKTLIEVNSEDPTYIKWAKENATSEPFHSLVINL